MWDRFVLQIPEGAAFAAWRWDSSSASGSSDFLSLGGGPQRRRLLQDGSSPADPSPPLVINSRTVAVDVADIGGFYYLTGGQATARPASTPRLLLTTDNDGLEALATSYAMQTQLHPTRA